MKCVSGTLLHLVKRSPKFQRVFLLAVFLSCLVKVEAPQFVLGTACQRIGGNTASSGACIMAGLLFYPLPFYDSVKKACFFLFFVFAFTCMTLCFWCSCMQKVCWVVTCSTTVNGHFKPQLHVLFFVFEYLIWNLYITSICCCIASRCETFKNCVV